MPTDHEVRLAAEVLQRRREAEEHAKVAEVRDKLAENFRRLQEDVEAARRHEGPLSTVLQPAPPQFEEPTPQELRLAALNAPPSGAWYEPSEPSGTWEEQVLDRAKHSITTRGRPAPKPPPPATEHRTPTLKLKED